MTATDELRRMLDERGVKWETDRSGFRVMWGKPVDEFHDTMQFKAVDNALPNGGLNVHICGFTPAQAIAATLDSSNCTNGERTNGTCHKVLDFDGAAWICSECGEHIGPRRWNYCPNCGRKVVEPTTNYVDAEVDDG